MGDKICKGWASQDLTRPDNFWHFTLIWPKKDWIGSDFETSKTWNNLESYGFSQNPFLPLEFDISEGWTQQLTRQKFLLNNNNDNYRVLTSNKVTLVRWGVFLNCIERQICRWNLRHFDFMLRLIWKVFQNHSLWLKMLCLQNKFWSIWSVSHYV